MKIQVVVVNFIQQNIYHNLESPNLNQAQLLLIDLERAEIVRLRYFQTVIDINCEDFPATVYVVPNSAITLDIIMGYDNLLQVNVSILQSEIIMIKQKKIMLADVYDQ